MNALRSGTRGLAVALGWLRRHRRYTWAWLLMLVITVLAGSGLRGILLAGACAPVLAAAWATASPTSYERRVAGPARRRAWRLQISREWDRIARQCGLARYVPQLQRVPGVLRRGWVEQVDWVAPPLEELKVADDSITLRLACAPGQTPAELTSGAERLSALIGAESYDTRQVSANEVQVHLRLVDHLHRTVVAAVPTARADLSGIRLGRVSLGGSWLLPILDRHTLVVGASGSGKGSVLWGVCGGLAPHITEDAVRLWGIDLKRGLELGMGRGLFSTVAFTTDDALQMLRTLIRTIDERGALMVGRSRLHRPTPGDPLHVLVIDELAALTAYADSSTAREAQRLLGQILTQGRALGVVVLACVQDPRKETISMRGLFTQTVALRLRSAMEVAMVLGEGLAERAPAHRIDPTTPGTAWVLEDDGNCTMARADYWPDVLVQSVAKTFATPVEIELDADGDPDDDAPPPTRPRAERKPRRPRSPRSGRRSREAA